jgi:WD40 repeat protein
MCNDVRADSAIWKISWANPKYGDLIGVATFTKKVSVFQLRGSEWHEVAYHSLHDGSVNEVKWAPYYYGLKLFACSSDGNISVLEVRNQAWHSQLFELKEMSISSLAVEKRSLLDDTVQHMLFRTIWHPTSNWCHITHTKME